MNRRILEFIKTTYKYFKGEIKLILHDWGAILILILAMYIYPVIYSIGYINETIKEISVAIVDLDNTATSRLLIQKFNATEQLSITYKSTSLKEAQQLFDANKIHGIIVIPKYFEKDVFRNQSTSISVYSDASYFLLYKQVYSGVMYASGYFNASVEIKRLLAEGTESRKALMMQDPLKVEIFSLYNPSGGYGTFVMPGIMLIILQQTMLIGIGLIGGTLRRRDRYIHLLHQITKPFGSVPVILGKSIAYVVIYITNAIFVLGIWYKVLNLPDKGNFWFSLFILIPYFFAIAFMGLAISVFFRERVHSLLFMVFLSPIVLFVSGISWPIESLPAPLVVISKFLPSSLAVPAYVKYRLLGANFSQWQSEYLYTVFMCVIYFILACISFKVMVKRISSRPPLHFS